MKHFIPSFSATYLIMGHWGSYPISAKEQTRPEQGQQHKTNTQQDRCYTKQHGTTRCIRLLNNNEQPVDVWDQSKPQELLPDWHKTLQSISLGKSALINLKRTNNWISHWGLIKSNWIERRQRQTIHSLCVSNSILPIPQMHNSCCQPPFHCALHLKTIPTVKYVYVTYQMTLFNTTSLFSPKDL